MCTMTWSHDGTTLRVFFNRDERRTRRTAEPPTIYAGPGVRFLAPRDPEGGGSWLAADEDGLCVSVLNGAASGEQPSGREYESRGSLPLALVGARDAIAAVGRLSELPLARFRPFVVAAVDCHGGTALVAWDGSSLVPADDDLRADQALVSSSFATEEVRRCRRETFARMLRERRPGESLLETHLAYHRSHEPERGPRAPCMHRPDARTVSFTTVEIGPRLVTMHYVPDAPCRGQTSRSVTLERRVAHSPS